MAREDKRFELRSLAANTAMPSEKVPQELRDEWRRINDELRRYRVSGENWDIAEKLMQEREKILEGIRKYEPSFAPAPKPLGYDDMVSLIPDSKTAIVELVVYDRAAAFVVFSSPVKPSHGFKSNKDKRIHFKEFNEIQEKQLHDEVNKFINASHSSEFKNNELMSVLTWLWDSIMGEIAEYLGSYGIERIIFVPHRDFHVLPIHAAYDSHNDRYLLDLFDITIVPSLWFLKHGMDRRGRMKSSDRLFAVVNPDRSLRYSDIEASWLEEMWEGEKVILRHDDATKKRIREFAGDSFVVHFSTHGTSLPIDDAFDDAKKMAEQLRSRSPESAEELEKGISLRDWDVLRKHGIRVEDYASPLRAFLLISGKDGENRLTVEELLRDFRFRSTYLAVLSACETGYGEFMKVTDPGFGLPAGFMLAGVPAVVASLWPVNDLSTALLMRKFYENWLAGNSVSTALRKAQQWLRNATVEELRPYANETWELVFSQRSPYDKLVFLRRTENLKLKPFESPYYWAGFVAYGFTFEDVKKRR